MKTRQLSPKSLKPDKDNPNSMTDRQFAALKKSIKKFGFLVPVIVDDKNNIIDGHHRTMAAAELNLKTIPVVNSANLTKNDRRLLQQIMNKLKGRHNAIKDAAIIQDMISGDRLKLESLGSDLGLADDDPLMNLIPKSKKTDITIKRKSNTLTFKFKNKNEYDEIVTTLLRLDRLNKENALLQLTRGKTVQ